MSNDHFDFAPYWLILEDAMRRDPVLESLMNDPDGRFTAQDWVTPDAAGTDTPSGHGSDKGIYVIKGNLEILLMFNDPEEQYSQYPTLTLPIPEGRGFLEGIKCSPSDVRNVP